MHQRLPLQRRRHHLRMVIVDKAFMHMDESRSKNVINYLTNTLGLQLIFIMPTSKAGPFLVGLLEKGETSFRKVSSHRRVLVANFVNYKQADAQQRKQAQDELAKLSQEDDMGY